MYKNYKISKENGLMRITAGYIGPFPSELCFRHIYSNGSFFLGRYYVPFGNPHGISFCFCGPAYQQGEKAMENVSGVFEGRGIFFIILTRLDGETGILQIGCENFYYCKKINFSLPSGGYRMIHAAASPGILSPDPHELCKIHDRENKNVILFKLKKHSPPRN
jgi:hypothetical protein